ncbi:hypothetical protein VKT23_003457 [Stygiomarasmius scandens]|uniref:Uncharacterized protein n=1 Tax=Marasmiellus scandens TaxID=2682957 RepID=A0ABR1JYQ0_9AGAR
MRGIATPGDILWQKLGSKSGIPPLPLEAAKQAFVSFAGDENLKDDEEKLEQLLVQLDCVPLAVNLMAQRAKSNSLDSLIRMWNDGRTSILKEGRGDPNKLNSVDFSIELSTNLLANDQIALELLSVFAFLPNGVPEWGEHLNKMLPSLGLLDLAVSALVECSLIYIENQDISSIAASQLVEENLATLSISEITITERGGLDVDMFRLHGEPPSHDASIYKPWLAAIKNAPYSPFQGMYPRVDREAFCNICKSFSHPTPRCPLPHLDDYRGPTTETNHVTTNLTMAGTGLEPEAATTQIEVTIMDEVTIVDEVDAAAADVAAITPLIRTSHTKPNPYY